MVTPQQVWCHRDTLCGVGDTFLTLQMGFKVLGRNSVEFRTAQLVQLIQICVWLITCALEG